MTTDRRSAQRASEGGVKRARRMPRAERREQILDAATRAFARTGFTSTSLDDVAAEAGVTHVILYRHFASKNDLYRAVLDRTCARLENAVGTEQYDEDSLPMLLRAAAADPDGFRLLFRHTTREPEFRDVIDAIRLGSNEIAHRHIAKAIPDGPWQNWAAQVIPVLTLESVIAWLDAGQPDPGHAAHRIGRAIRGVIQAATHAE